MWRDSRLTKVPRPPAPSCDLKPVSKVSLPARRLRVFRLQWGRVGPSLMGMFIFMTSAPKRRGHSLPWDAGNDLFFPPLMFFHKLIVAGLKLMTLQNEV